VLRLLIAKERLQIFQRRPHQARVVSVEPNSGIAGATEQSAHLAGGMTMVDAQPLRGYLFADYTGPALPRRNGVVAARKHWLADRLIRQSGMFVRHGATQRRALARARERRRCSRSVLGAKGEIDQAARRPWPRRPRESKNPRGGSPAGALRPIAFRHLHDGVLEVKHKNGGDIGWWKAPLSPVSAAVTN
jgi:hypothetical protein